MKQRHSVETMYDEWRNAHVHFKCIPFFLLVLRNLSIVTVPFKKHKLNYILNNLIQVSVTIYILYFIVDFI